MTTNALAGFASALRVPVRVAAILLLVVLAFELGRLLIEAWRRVRPGSVGLERVTLEALSAPGSADLIARGAPGPLAERAVLGLAHAAAGTSSAGGAPGAGGTAGGGAAGAGGAAGGDAFESALADYELQVQRRLDRTRMMVRAGPAVGLMGTLIPLAPGLSALGQGDYQTLADDLKVAFAATVAGLLVGTVAFALTLVRTRLYTEDLAALEHAVALHEPQLPAHHRLDAAVGVHDA